MRPRNCRSVDSRMRMQNALLFGGPIPSNSHYKYVKSHPCGIKTLIALAHQGQLFLTPYSQIQTNCS